MIPKFRAYHIESQIMAKVVELHLENKMATLDIYTNKIYPNSDYWWKETEVPYSEIKLMQSTGLKDVNGNEIYEGDIVLNIQNNFVGKIYWDIHNVGFYKGIKRKGIELLDSFTLFRSEHNLKIIGNIYENKELLEVTE